jgi:hypothetical protein
MKQIGVSATVQTRKKISCDSRGVRHSREDCSCARISGVKKQIMFCYLPPAVLKDICICQLHVILLHRRNGPHLVQIVQRSPTEISEQHLNIHPKSNLKLLLKVKERVQCVATVKCA